MWVLCECPENCEKALGLGTDSALEDPVSPARVSRFRGIWRIQMRVAGRVPAELALSDCFVGTRFAVGGDR